MIAWRGSSSQRGFQTDQKTTVAQLATDKWFRPFCFFNRLKYFLHSTSENLRPNSDKLLAHILNQLQMFATYH